jgi:hypothetical protein
MPGWTFHRAYHLKAIKLNPTLPTKYFIIKKIKMILALHFRKWLFASASLIAAFAFSQPLLAQN